MMKDMTYTKAQLLARLNGILDDSVDQITKVPAPADQSTLAYAAWEADYQAAKVRANEVCKAIKIINSEFI